MKKSLYTIAISLLFTACHTHTFLPLTQNVPLFTDKGQATVGGAITYRSVEYHGAYSPIKKLAVMGSIQYTNTIVPELGIGTYSSLFKNKVIGEVYGGIAYCYIQYQKEDEKIKSIIGNPNGHYNFDIDMQGCRFFIQPNLGFRFSDKINLGFSARSCLWYFTNYEFYREKWDYYNANGSNRRLTDKDSMYFKNTGCITVEPAITLRIGGKYGKFMMQTGLNLNMTNPKKEPVPYHTAGMFIRFGFNVFVDFNDFKKKKTNINTLNSIN